MAVTDFFAGEIATEVIKQLLLVCQKSRLCKSTADQLIASIQEIAPIIHEIKYSGVELPQHRQSQLDQFSQALRDGLQLCHKVLASSRWNVYKNLQLARKMEKIEKRISRFMTVTLQAHLLADVHHVRVENQVGIERLEEKMGVLRVGGGVLVEEEIRRVEEEERERGSLGNVKVGTGLVVGKKKVKEMLMEKQDFQVVGIQGMGGCGKTTLAREISRDEQVQKHFRNVIFLTVSQSPNVDQLRKTLWAQITGNQFVGSNHTVPQWHPQWNQQFDWRIRGRTLIILDDVWSLPVLEKLIFNMPGCKTLVVSRFQFPTVVNSFYELELLRDDEAMSLFCYSTFGQKSIPFPSNHKLVEQVVKECKGLPLALKVIGASLRDKSEMFWKSAAKRLSRGEAVCDSHETKLLERMAISIDYLSKTVKECFLDLGSFPEDKKIPLDVVVNMWVEIHDIDEDEAFAILTELSNKNLITLVKDPRAGDIYSSYFEISVTQHDVLRDLALHKSNGGGVNERQRLLMPRREERLPREWERNMDQPFQAQILSIHTGDMNEWDWFSMDFPKVEVLILNCSSSEYYLPPFIDRMPKLKALIIMNSGVSNTVLTNLSVFASMHKLRSLYLEKVTVPQPPDTNIRLPNLRKISLVLCEANDSLKGSLLDFPDILPSLAELALDHCVNLTGLPSNICMISSLRIVSITNCHDLNDLPAELGMLKLLQILRLCACPSLKKLPQSLSELDKLKYLDIYQCVNLKSLPEGMGGLTRLEKIDMRECSEIRRLPASVKSMRYLERVICNQEAAWLWQQVENVLPELKIQVEEECFTLDWLAD